MNQAVVCIAPDVSEAEREVATLREVGFSTDDISVLWPDMAGAQELGYEHHTKAPEGMAWGVFFGAIVGGISAYLDFIGVLWMPFSAQMITAGPVMSVLSGVAVGGFLGYLLGFVIGLAFPEYEAKKYERKIQSGNTLVAVHTDSNDEIKTAEQALKKTAAIGIHHIEETGRLKRKCSQSNPSDQNVAKAMTIGLIFSAMAATIGTACAADNTTPISQSAKKDEQKAEMPPDLTSTKQIQEPLTGNAQVDPAVLEKAKDEADLAAKKNTLPHTLAK